jgi:hypothetical protein
MIPYRHPLWTPCYIAAVIAYQLLLLITFQNTNDSSLVTIIQARSISVNKLPLFVD